MIAYYRDWIIEELDNWSQTFNTEYPESFEDDTNDESKSFDYIQSLIQKFFDDNCSKKDYEDILFHLWQMKATD